jgi:hypothetical protein
MFAKAQGPNVNNSVDTSQTMVVILAGYTVTATNIVGLGRMVNNGPSEINKLQN